MELCSKDKDGEGERLSGVSSPQIVFLLSIRMSVSSLATTSLKFESTLTATKSSSSYTFGLNCIDYVTITFPSRECH